MRYVLYMLPSSCKLQLQMQRRRFSPKNKIIRVLTMRLVLANSLGPDNDDLVSALEGFLCHDAAGAVWIDNHDHLVSIHHKCRRSISRSRRGCILRRGRGTGVLTRRHHLRARLAHCKGFHRSVEDWNKMGELNRLVAFST